MILIIKFYFYIYLINLSPGLLYQKEPSEKNSLAAFICQREKNAGTEKLGALSKATRC